MTHDASSTDPKVSLPAVIWAASLRSCGKKQENAVYRNRKKTMIFAQTA